MNKMFCLRKKTNKKVIHINGSEHTVKDNYYYYMLQHILPSTRNVFYSQDIFEK